MNIDVIYNACMKKVASRVNARLHKVADEQPAAAQPAYVGPATPSNEYARQLHANAQNYRAKAIADARPNANGSGSQLLAEARAGANLSRVMDWPTERFYGDRVHPQGGIITQPQLNKYRNIVARTQAHLLFDRGTKQHEAAQQYLIERGKENQRRYQEGTLWKNEPSKVPMPAVISKPEDQQALNYAGFQMAHNKRKNPNRGNA